MNNKITAKQLLTDDILNIINEELDEGMECRYCLPHEDDAIKVVIYKTVSRVEKEYITIIQTNVSKTLEEGNYKWESPVIKALGDYEVSGIRLDKIHDVVASVQSVLEDIDVNEYKEVLNLLKKLKPDNKLIIRNGGVELKYLITDLGTTKKNTMCVVARPLDKKGKPVKNSKGAIPVDILLDRYREGNLDILYPENKDEIKIVESE